MKNRLFSFGMIAVLFGASLCLGWHHHQIRPLSTAAEILIPPFKPDEKKVDVQVKVLTAEESSQLLGHDLLKRGVQPVQLTIQNNTPNEYALSPESVDLKHLEPKDVANKIQKSALPRSIGFKVLGFFFWPFMIPGTIDTIHTFHTYKLLKKDYQAKSMKDEVIAVYSTFHRILFVSKSEFKEKFTVTLTDISKQEPVVFDIASVNTVAAETQTQEPELQNGFYSYSPPG